MTESKRLDNSAETHREAVDSVFGAPLDEVGRLRRQKQLEELRARAGTVEPARVTGSTGGPPSGAPPRAHHSGMWTLPPVDEPSGSTSLPPMAAFEPIDPGESSEFTLAGGELWLHVRDARHRLIGAMTGSEIGEKLADGRLTGKEMVSLDRVNWIGIRYLDRLAKLASAAADRAVEALDGPARASEVDGALPPRIETPDTVDRETDGARAPAEAPAVPSAVPPAPAHPVGPASLPADAVPDLVIDDPLAPQPPASVGRQTLDVRPPVRRASWSLLVVIGLVVGSALAWLLVGPPSTAPSVMATEAPADDESNAPAEIARLAPVDVAVGEPEPADPAAPAPTEPRPAVVASAVVSPDAEAIAPADAEQAEPPSIGAEPTSRAVAATPTADEPEQPKAAEARPAVKPRRVRRAPGRLRIEGATTLAVRVDGRDVGRQTPTELELEPGTRRVELVETSSGRTVLSRRVRVAAGRLAVVTAPVPEAPAAESARVAGDPPEAVAEAEPAPSPPAADGANPASAGEDAVVDARPAPEAFAAAEDVGAHAAGTSAATAPEPPTVAAEPAVLPKGYVSVSNRSAVLVLIDGVSTGKRTPLWMHPVPAGQHLIELRDDAGDVIGRRTVDVPANQTVPVLFR